MNLRACLCFIHSDSCLITFIEFCRGIMSPNLQYLDNFVWIQALRSSYFYFVKPHWSWRRTEWMLRTSTYKIWGRYHNHHGGFLACNLLVSMDRSFLAERPIREWPIISSTMYFGPRTSWWVGYIVANWTALDTWTVSIATESPYQSLYLSLL
jgi:hypothetical protein